LKSEKEQLMLKLAEGYQATKLEDISLAKEFNLPVAGKVNYEKG